MLTSDALLRDLIYAALGSFGALSQYCWSYIQKDIRFNKRDLFFNCVVGLWVGLLTVQFVDDNNDFLKGYVLLSGFCCHPLLMVIEEKSNDWFGWLVNKKDKED